MKLPFHERYDCESDTTLTRIGGNDGDILIQRNGEELIYEIADNDHKLFIYNHLGLVFNARMMSHTEFFDWLCTEPKFTEAGWEVRNACKRVMLSDMLWLYAHRPKHWNLPLSREDARMEVKRAGDDIAEQLNEQTNNIPSRYDQTVLVGFARTTKQGMLNGVPHTYHNVTLSMSHFARFGGKSYLTSTKIHVPG